MICFRSQSQLARSPFRMSSPHRHWHRVTVDVFLQKVKVCLIIYIFVKLLFWCPPFSQQIVFKLCSQAESHLGWTVTEPQRWSIVCLCTNRSEVLAVHSHSMSIRKSITAQLCQQVRGVFFFPGLLRLRLRNGHNLDITMISYGK